MAEFRQLLKTRAAEIEAAIDTHLPTLGTGPMAEPMRYAMLNGGKRLRGFLAIESAALFDIPVADALPAAVAIEAIHAYSLVHDDLPCMDDDDLRRGQPTVHKKWDDATAVLTGDALQTIAFEILTKNYAPEIAVNLVHSLAVGSGAMVLGQAQDIAAETASKPLDLNEISELQSNKTGALIIWSAQAGARIASADIAPLTEYATALGRAFQIQDDILDVEGDAVLAGKALQKDADAGKATFVSLLGLDGAKAEAQRLVDAATSALDPFGEKALNLRDCARFVIEREL